MSDGGLALRGRVGKAAAVALTMLLFVVAAGCGGGREPGPRAGLTLLQVDSHGAVGVDSASHRLIGFDRVGRQLSEAWQSDLDPGRVLDVACAVQCPRVSLLVQDPGNATGSRVEFLDGSGHRQEEWSATVNAGGTLLHVFRWREESTLFLRSRDSAVEVVARYGTEETAVPVTSTTATVEANVAGTSVVVLDEDVATVLSISENNAWQVVQRIPATAEAACVAPDGGQVLIAGNEDVLVAIPSGRVSRIPSTLPHVGACAIGQGWMVKGVLRSVNEAPSSEWTAQQPDGQLLWRHTYQELADVVMTRSGDIACIAFDRPVCLTAGDEKVADVTGPVTAASDGTIMYAAGDGRLAAVS